MQLYIISNTKWQLNEFWGVSGICICTVEPKIFYWWWVVTGFHLLTFLFCTVWYNMIVAQILYLPLSLKRIRFFCISTERQVIRVYLISRSFPTTPICHFKRLGSVWSEFHNIFWSVMSMTRRQLEIWVFKGKKFFW
jgi:hypothetical protein